MRLSIIYYVLAIAIILTTGCKKRYSDGPRDLSIFERIAHERTDDDVMEDFIDSLLLRMSLVDKVGQMTQINESFFSVEDASGDATGTQAITIDTAKLKTVIQTYQIGSILQGGVRTAEEWAGVCRFFQEVNMMNSTNEIPLIFGIDHIHGANFLAEGTVFPHQLNIGATFNPAFAYDMGKYTALEAASLGHHWNFAPVLGIGIKKNWPRLYGYLSLHDYGSRIYNRIAGNTNREL
jgi:beta-glucosidase